MLIVRTQMRTRPTECRDCDLHKCDIWEDVECAVLNLPSPYEGIRDDCPLEEEETYLWKLMTTEKQ